MHCTENETTPEATVVLAHTALVYAMDEPASHHGRELLGGQLEAIGDPRRVELDGTLYPADGAGHRIRCVTHAGTNFGRNLTHRSSASSGGIGTPSNKHSSAGARMPFRLQQISPPM